MIEGVTVRPLVKRMDDRGYLMEILRDDDPEFTRFGQVYVSTCLPGIVKAWHAHRVQIDRLCVLKGMAKIGMYDGREGSPTYRQTQAVVTSELNSMLVVVPAGVWHGYMCLGTEPLYIMNLPSAHYDRAEPDELRVDPFENDFGFDWQPKSH